MIMKSINKVWLSLAVVLLAMGAQASLDIPDGNPIGVTSTIGVNGLGTIGSDITVTLNITGGNNGDLYAYLSYNGQLVTLLDRPGVTGSDPLGETDPGYSSVVLSDAGSMNIDNANGGGSAVTGTYLAAAGAGALSVYTGGGSDGTWTLFIADLSGGDLSGSDSQLVGWYLTINGTTVPEPITWALIVFGVLGSVAQYVVWRLRRRIA
jgi:subtilisin-like proprotein convertase family protein